MVNRFNREENSVSRQTGKKHFHRGGESIADILKCQPEELDSDKQENASPDRKGQRHTSEYRRTICRSAEKHKESPIKNRNQDSRRPSPELEE